MCTLIRGAKIGLAQASCLTTSGFLVLGFGMAKLCMWALFTSGWKFNIFKTCKGHM